MALIYVLNWLRRVDAEQNVLRLVHMHPAVESEAKVVYKEPQFVIEDNSL